jgi:hypothetical protein
MPGSTVFDDVVVGKEIVERGREDAIESVE